jgi:glycosyltransferase involved in cell wall biosynthesis
MIPKDFPSHHLLINLSFLFSQPTGIATYATNLIPHLQELNPILLTAAKTFKDFNCYLIPDNLTPDWGTIGHVRRLGWTQFKLPKIYKKFQPSLLFSPVPEAPLYQQCRSVVMVHDLIPLRFSQRFSPLTPYFRYYIPQVLAQAEHIICNSIATATDIIDFWNISAAKITPIPLAYSSDHFRSLDLTGQREAILPYFLYIGRHDPYKNLSRLINAFAALSNCRDHQLWLAGSPDQRYTPELKAQVEELGLIAQVKFLNYVPYDQLPMLINQAIALVFPTLWEGFGLPVLEAMACGTPVITSNLSSLPEVAGDAALLINPYHTQEITAAMQAIAADTQLRSQLSNLGLQRARQFSWTKTGQATREILQQYL